MLEVYLDDSGTHGGPYCFIAGYLAHVDQWAAFADRWHVLLGKYLNGRPLHMAQANRVKDRGFVPVEGLVEFAHCIIDHVQFEIWSVLPEYYARQILDRYGARFDKYRTCYLGVLQEFLNDYHVGKLTEPVRWVFDHQGGSDPAIASDLELSLIRSFNDAKSVVSPEQRHLLSGIAFEDDEVASPLQAADFLAWHKRRFHATGIDDPTHPAYAILREAKIKRVEAIWFDHKLEDLLDKLTAPRPS
ncbi:MAG: DUF3800 domain-containing protein [Terriglobales bacterium]